jgi:hypothetical protein
MVGHGVTGLTRGGEVNHRNKLLHHGRYKQVMTMRPSAVVIPIVPDIELKRILYATDFSDPSLAALPQVSTMARRYGSRVFVVNVWTPAPYSMVSPEAASALQHKDEREARAKARELLNRRELAGLPATVIVANRKSAAGAYPGGA